MKGFRNTKTGTIYGDFNLSRGSGEIGGLGQPLIQRFAEGGLVGRAKPSSELDRVSGGKTPLRPGYSCGGKAKKKYAEGGKVKGLSKLMKARKELRKSMTASEKARTKGGYTVSDIDQPLEGPMDMVDWFNGKSGAPKRDTPKDNYAEGGKVKSLKAALKTKDTSRKGMADQITYMKNLDPENYKNYRKGMAEARNKPKEFAEGGKVGKLKAMVKSPSFRTMAERKAQMANRQKRLEKPAPDAARDMKLSTFSRGGRARY